LLVGLSRVGTHGWFLLAIQIRQSSPQEHYLPNFDITIAGELNLDLILRTACLAYEVCAFSFPD
jgi:hypothetical protein